MGNGQEMIRFMGMIVDATDEFIKQIGKGVIKAFSLFAKFILVITAPGWILPYKMIRWIKKKRKNLGG